MRPASRSRTWARKMAGSLSGISRLERAADPDSESAWDGSCKAHAARHGRGITKTDIGTTIKDPNVDYATVARGFGVYGEGPITDPNDLGPALKRAIAMVKTGQPALVDVVMDPR